MIGCAVYSTEQNVKIISGLMLDGKGWLYVLKLFSSMIFEKMCACSDPGFRTSIKINGGLKKQAHQGLSDYIVVLILVVFKEIRIINPEKDLILPAGIDTVVFLENLIMPPVAIIRYLPIKVMIMSE